MPSSDLDLFVSLFVLHLTECGSTSLALLAHMGGYYRNFITVPSWIFFFMLLILEVLNNLILLNRVAGITANKKINK